MQKGTKIESKKNGVNISISNKVKLDTQNPIPLEGKETFVFGGNSAYLPFLAGQDNFAQVLLEARLLSTTHGACIKTKRDFCAGNSFINADKGELDAKFKTWLKSINLKDESAIKINQKVFESHFQYGNTPIELVRYTIKGEKRLFVYVHNFTEWRLCPPDEDGVCREAIHSKLFNSNRIVTLEELKKAKKLPIFSFRNTDKKNWKPIDGVERTLIWYKNEFSGYPNYGLPSSIGSLIYQLLEYKGARYNMDGFENGWVVSAILTLKGIISPTENQKIAREIIGTHTGDGNRSRVVVLSSEKGLEGSEIHQLDTQKDGSFIESDEQWSQKIIFANEWDAILAGLLSPSTMGKGEGFISKIYEIKQKTVIIPAQTDLIDNVWNTIFQIAREFLGLNIPENMAIKSSANISSLSDVDLTPAVTVDEVREANNLPKLGNEKGNMLMGELSASQKTKKEDVPVK